MSYQEGGIKLTLGLKCSPNHPRTHTVLDRGMRGTPLAVTADTEEGTIMHKLFCVHKKKMHAPLEGLKNFFLQYHSISTNLNCITVLS